MEMKPGPYGNEVGTSVFNRDQKLPDYAKSAEVLWSENDAVQDIMNTVQKVRGIPDSVIATALMIVGTWIIHPDCPHEEARQRAIDFFMDILARADEANMEAQR